MPYSGSIRGFGSTYIAEETPPKIINKEDGNCNVFETDGKPLVFNMA
jgi:hypothetical protein